MGTKITASELQLADKVSLGDSPYMSATVKQIREETVVLWRPYVACSEVAYAGNQVILTIGIETVELWKGDRRPLELLERVKSLF